MNLRKDHYRNTLHTMTAYDSVHVMCSCEEEVEEEGRSLGHRLSAALRIQMSQFRARTTQHTRTAPVYQCDHQSSPDPLPGDHTHGACLCALRKHFSGSGTREQENERDRPTERPRGGLASLDRGTERKRVRQVRPMSAYTTCTQRYHRLRVVRALTHGYDWSSTHRTTHR